MNRTKVRGLFKTFRCARIQPRLESRGFLKNPWHKKGFIRIVEASIAIMIILGALLMISSDREERITRDLTEILYPILDEVAQNQTLRVEIIQVYDTSISSGLPPNNNVIFNLKKFLNGSIRNPSLKFDISICELNFVCPIEPYPDTDEEIYAVERVISTSIDESAFAPRKLKIFLWRA